MRDPITTECPHCEDGMTAETPVADEQVTSIKGFDLSWKCRDFQFALGHTYTHDGPVIACESGFHAVEYPLDVLGYYPPGQSRYAEVTQSVKLARHSGDTKIASAKLTVGIELSIPDLVTRAIVWIVEHATNTGKHTIDDHSAASSTGDRSAASSTGYRSAASSTGYRSAASSTSYHSAASSTGDRSAASSTGYQSAASSTGYQSAASSTGYQSAASSTGYQSAASSTGDQSAASSTGYQSAASSTGYRSAASSTGAQSAASSTGDQSAASSTGDRSAASSTGAQSAASSTGDRSAASSTGAEGRVMGIDGNALFLVYRNPADWSIKHAWAGIVGQNGIRPEVWYTLNADGQPVEWGV